MPDVSPILIDGAWTTARARATREIRNAATLAPLGRLNPHPERSEG
jgi:hypothetical protein